MFLRTSSPRGIKKKIGSAAGLIIILAILLSFTMWFRYVQHSFTFQYAETNFDLIVKGFSEKQISQIQRLAFVTDVFPVRIFTTEAKCGTRRMLIDVYAADSFNLMDASYFADRLLIRASKQILTSNALNPIIIDREIAGELNARIGDSILLLFGKDKTEIPFTVAAISEPLQDLPEVLILWRGEQKSIYKKAFEENPVYSLMFVKTKDKERAKSYFLNEFIPMQMIGEGLLDIDDSNEINRFNRAMLIDREEYLRELRYELRYTPPIVAVTSMLGFIAYLMVLYRETNKIIVQQKKDFSILYSLGMPRIYFMYHLISETLLLHGPSLLAAILLTKYVVYDYLMRAFLPWYLFIWYGLGSFALLLMAIVVNGFIFYAKLKKTNMAVQLAEE